MPTSDELLNSLLDTVPEHTHQVIDDDTYFVIDPTTRLISNATGTTNYLMQYDHASERFTFELPRYVDGHDMMLCTSVRVYYNNIDQDTGRTNEDTYDVDDLRVDPKNTDNVICTWLINRQATQYAGTLNFIVHYVCVDEGENVYEWFSDIYSDVLVKPGRNHGEGSIIEYTDLLEEWRTRLFGEKDSLVADIQAASATEQAEIEAKGAETLASIPSDYTAVSEMADEALRRKADAIELTESSDGIFLNDSSDCNLVGLNIYGKTTQVSTTGKNLIPYPFYETTKRHNNVLYVDNGDGSITLNGTASSYTSFTFLDNRDADAQSVVNAINGKTFTVSGNNHDQVTLVVQKYDANGADEYRVHNGTAVQTYTDSGAPGTYKVFVAINAGVVLDNYTVWPMVELGESASPFEIGSGGVPTPSPDNPQPLNSVENPSIMLTGNNLFNINATPVTVLNSTYTVEGTSIAVTASAGVNTLARVEYEISYMPKRFYELSFNATVHNADSITGTPIVCMRKGSTYQGDARLILDGNTHSYRTIICPPEAGYNLWLYNKPSGEMAESVSITYNNLQIRPVEVPDSYYPFSEEQTLTLPYTLRGIPVSQNGNYTDSNGQQWVCDEIDFERGKFIQRVQSMTLPNTFTINVTTNEMWYQLSDRLMATTESESPICLCNYFPSTSRNSIYDNAFKEGYYAIAVRDRFIRIVDNVRFNGDVTALNQWIGEHMTESDSVVFEYILNTPIETDLTSAEMEAFRALHTNATDTTITNDHKTNISVKYVADLERYIHKNVSNKRARFDLTLVESKWVESSDGRYYTQTLDINARPNSEINLHPTAEQQVSLILDGIAMFVANENGVCTAYAIAGTPGKDITIPATETVVVYE